MINAISAAKGGVADQLFRDIFRLASNRHNRILRIPHSAKTLERKRQGPFRRNGDDTFTGRRQPAAPGH